MARDDGKRYGAGGVLIETVEPQVEDVPYVQEKKATKVESLRRTSG